MYNKLIDRNYNKKNNNNNNNQINSHDNYCYKRLRGGMEKTKIDITLIDIPHIIIINRLFIAAAAAFWLKH